jgi:hypothetical protein
VKSGRGGKLTHGTLRKALERFAFPLFRKSLVLLTSCSPLRRTTHPGIVLRSTVVLASSAFLGRRTRGRMPRGYTNAKQPVIFARHFGRLAVLAIPSLIALTCRCGVSYKKRRTVPVINKEALELLPKQMGMMAYEPATKGNWSGVLLGFLLGELLAGLTVNTRMGWLTVWLPLVLPAGFVSLCAAFAQIQYHRAVRRYRPSTPSVTSPQPQPSPTTEVPAPLSPAELPPPLPPGLSHSRH